MNPVTFPEQNFIIAADQPPYRPLPGHLVPNPLGQFTVCWKLSWRERLTVLRRGVLWQQILTFNQPLQPQLLLTEKPTL